MSELKQFTGRRTSSQEHVLRGIASGTAQVRGHNHDGSQRLFWMPGFVPLEYLRAVNRDRLGVTEPDPVFPAGSSAFGEGKA
jgi:hypothetical protein